MLGFSTAWRWQNLEGGGSVWALVGIGANGWHMLHQMHFVYLYLICSLELSFVLFPLIFSLLFSTTLDSLHVYHMYAIFSHVIYLLSHAYDIHMLTVFTCLQLSHAYHFISSIPAVIYRLWSNINSQSVFFIVFEVCLMTYLIKPYLSVCD